ncbi:hypothetical protein ACOSQ2_029959 [Xanthoceras sorbifolium]
MASRKIFPAKPNYIYPTPPGAGTIRSDVIFEFEESDMWRSSTESATMESNKKPIPSSRSSKKLSKKSFDLGDHHHRIPVASASLPVNIPDWSKILKEEYREHSKIESDEDADVNNNNNNDDDDLVPPHEYLAMRRGASLSVHEGIGRTLKGRDLRRVRNAIWQKVGFED